MITVGYTWAILCRFVLIGDSFHVMRKFQIGLQFHVHAKLQVFDNTDCILKAGLILPLIPISISSLE